MDISNPPPVSSSTLSSAISESAQHEKLKYASMTQVGAKHMKMGPDQPLATVLKAEVNLWPDSASKTKALDLLSKLETRGLSADETKDFAVIYEDQKSAAIVNAKNIMESVPQTLHTV